MSSVIVLGGGPGGVAAALRAARLGADVVLIEAILSAGDDETRHEALQIPLPGAGQCLIEIVEVEYLHPLR